MAERKAGRPFVYQSEGEKPVSFSVRIPRDLYEQAQKYVKMRPKMTLTELLLDGLRLRLETPADPRDLILSDDNTVMQELQEMVETTVEAALAKRQPTQAPAPAPRAPAPVPTGEELPSYNGNTVIQGRGRMRQPILVLLSAHPEGLTAEEIRVHLKPAKPIGDTLQGMRDKRVIRFVGSGKERRYFVG